MSRTQYTTAGVNTLWEILSDARLLPHWVPAVESVDKCEMGGETIGAVRHCSVKLGGRSGTMVEQCVDMVRGESITYAVREDSFGIAKMLSDYVFRISLRAADGGRTEVVIDTYYTPRNLGYAFLNAMVMRRQFRAVIAKLLAGLCALAEKHDVKVAPGA